MGDKKENPRILIVDDVEANRFVLRDIINSMGYEPVLTENGVQALRMLQYIKPQLIILDIAMPEMDGYDATMKIRKLPNRIRANVPIIALTVNAVAENRERASAVGMDGFLVKPASSARLLRILSKFL